MVRRNQLAISEVVRYCNSETYLNIVLVSLHICIKAFLNHMTLYLREYIQDLRNDKITV
jgi:hypothetical protein